MIINIILLTGLGIALLALSYGYVELNIINSSNSVHNRRWHWYKGLFQGVFYAAIGLGVYGFHWKLILFVIMLLALTVVIFNPVINKVRKRGDFFYIANAGIEGYFYNTPKLYYFLNLIIFTGLYVTLNHIL